MLIYDVVHYRKLSILIIKGCNFFLCDVYVKKKKNNSFPNLILKVHIVKFGESEAITFDILKYFNVEYNFIEKIKISPVIFMR